MKECPIQEISASELETQARQGDPIAQFCLGLSFLHNTDTVNSVAQTVKWWTASAKSGYVTAQYNLGVLFQKGLGVPVDYPVAMKWYVQAAAQSYPEAENNLGWMYYMGEGVNRNPIQAHAWFSLAECDSSVRASAAKLYVERSLNEGDLQKSRSLLSAMISERRHQDAPKNDEPLDGSTTSRSPIESCLGK